MLSNSKQPVFWRSWALVSFAWSSMKDSAPWLSTFEQVTYCVFVFLWKEPLFKLQDNTEFSNRTSSKFTSHIFLAIFILQNEEFISAIIVFSCLLTNQSNQPTKPTNQTNQPFFLFPVWGLHFQPLVSEDWDQLRLPLRRGCQVQRKRQQEAGDPSRSERRNGGFGWWLKVCVFVIVFQFSRPKWCWKNNVPLPTFPTNDVEKIEELCQLQDVF